MAPNAGPTLAPALMKLGIWFILTAVEIESRRYPSHNRAWLTRWCVRKPVSFGEAARNFLSVAPISAKEPNVDGSRFSRERSVVSVEFLSRMHSRDHELGVRFTAGR